MNKKLYILLLILTVSCGISEDCFKGNGNKITKVYPVVFFAKVKVYSGINLEVKQGADYEVKIETSDNIIDAIEVEIQDNMLVIKDNSSCNLVRDYDLTTVYITAPNLEEIHNKTDKIIKSKGVLNYPILRLFAMGDDGDESGTGDFYLNLALNEQLIIEKNTNANFYINGTTEMLAVNFYFGDGRFYGENLEAQQVSVYHRGSNDIIVRPMQRIEGQILSTGDVILKNNPPEIDVEELFTGQLLYE